MFFTLFFLLHLRGIYSSVANVLREMDSLSCADLQSQSAVTTNIETDENALKVVYIIILLF